MNVPIITEDYIVTDVSYLNHTNEMTALTFSRQKMADKVV